jgi:hypothetical protein
MKTHNNIPERLNHLYDLPFAHFIGVSPGGVDWVAYQPENIAPMRSRLRTMTLKACLSERARNALWV